MSADVEARVAAAEIEAQHKADVEVYLELMKGSACPGLG